MRKGILVGLVVAAAVASGAGAISAQVPDGSGDSIVARHDPWPKTDPGRHEPWPKASGEVVTAGYGYKTATSSISGYGYKAGTVAPAGARAGGVTAADPQGDIRI